MPDPCICPEFVGSAIDTLKFRDSTIIVPEATGTLTTENLTGMGFSDRELVCRVVASTLPDEITIVPTTSSDLCQWSFTPLRFLDATDIGGGRKLFRYCMKTPHDPVRFFRAGSFPPLSTP